jgi:hypothetical protein
MHAHSLSLELSPLSVSRARAAKRNSLHSCSFSSVESWMLVLSCCLEASVRCDRSLSYRHRWLEGTRERGEEELFCASEKAVDELAQTERIFVKLCCKIDNSTKDMLCK